MRYIHQRMKDKLRIDIEQTPLKTEIEALFSESNIDEDCDTIASLLSPYREAVRESLSQGNYAEAVTILLEVLKASLTTSWKTSITTISMICTARIMFAKT